VADRVNPRERPPDPAGTRPRVDPESLLPSDRTPLLPPSALDVEAVEIEAPQGELSSPSPSPSPSQPPPDAPPPAPPLEAVAATVEPSTELVPAPAAGSLGAVQPPISEHTPRFQFLLGALGALGVCAVALALALIFAPQPAPPPPWGPWQPSVSSPTPLSDIANHVSSEYRLAGGAQLFPSITAGVAEVSGVPVAVEVQTGKTFVDPPGIPVLYTLCGGGAPHCTLVGRPSAQRILLIRRAALELALYTLRYIQGASEVIVLLPPLEVASPGKRPHEQAGDAMLFTSTGLQNQINAPFTDTLEPVTPSAATIVKSDDTPAVERLTLNSLYTVKLELSDTAQVMFLQPIAFA
jgi:hypothetical protein